MTYRERFAARPGSFRGASFLTPQNELEGGRRGVVHQYPGRDEHTAQDLGKMAATFMVTAIVIGPDYDVARDALIRALETPGAGKLVHRFYGELNAQIEPGKKYRVTETQDQGGMATFQIPFIRAGSAQTPSVTIDSAARARSAADASRTASLGAFLRKFDATGIEQVRASAFETIQDANNTLSEVNSRISGALATPTLIAGQIQTFGNSVATLVATPSRYGELADGFAAIVGAIFGVVAAAGSPLLNVTGEDAAEAQIQARKVFGLNREAQASISALGTGESDNDQAILGLVTQLAATEAARTATETPYDSRDSAIATLDALADALLAQAEASGDDDVYAALIDLRVELSRYLSSAAGALPGVVPHVTVRTLPALLIAHLVHGDARRAEEIIARNNIAHPGFVQGGVTLQVLAND